MPKFRAPVLSILFCAANAALPIYSAQAPPPPPIYHKAPPEKVIIDTDIGDDIDDAFAVALALRSPELQILGITTTFGDTETRAKLLDRFLAEAGRPEIPVAAGVPTPPKSTFTHPRYAENNRFPKPAHPDALTLLYHQWGQETPTLFDPMTITFLVNPNLCPVQPMHIRVDEKGFTRPDAGAPNAQVCLDSNPDAFFRFYLYRLAAP